MPETTAPTPTIGRRVYFWPRRPGSFNLLDYRQPFDAGVVFAHGPGDLYGRVNLLVTDHLGRTHQCLNVPFGDFDRTDLTDKETANLEDANGYADWMPYQKGAQTAAAPGAQLLGESDKG